MNARMRKTLSVPWIIEVLDRIYSQVDEGVPRASSCHYPMRDCLMSALALFAFKCPSLLRFEQRVRGDGMVSRAIFNACTGWGGAGSVGRDHAASVWIGWLCLRRALPMLCASDSARESAAVLDAIC